MALVLADPMTPRVQRSPTIRDADGDERLVRRSVTLQPFPSLVCPNGHRMKSLAYTLSEVTFQCRYRWANGQYCDLSLYVITDWRESAAARLSLVVSVTPDEIQRMRRMPMRDKLLYLGLNAEVRHADSAN